MKEKIKLVDLSDWELPYASHVNTYYLSWFELMRYHEDKFVWFGVGQWSSHIMDWRGCNFWHGRLPKSPIFKTGKEAIAWLFVQIKGGIYTDGMELNGHHMGDDGRCKNCNKDESDWIFDRRETNFIVYFSYIIGTAKQRISQQKLLKDNERELI